MCTNLRVFLGLKSRDELNVLVIRTGVAFVGELSSMLRQPSVRAPLPSS